MHARLEERDRKVEGLGLDVLRQTDERRAAIGRVEHGRQRLRQRLQDLFRSYDAIPVPHDRFERVVHRDARIAEVFDLLQHRVGGA